MNIVCDREQLWSAFQTAAVVAPPRTPRAILKNVRMDVDDRGTILVATDMEVGIRIDVSGIEMTAGGSVLLPVAQLGSILRESVDQKLRIEGGAQEILVQGERSEFRLPTQNPDEFPAVATFSEESYYELSSRLFRELIRRTLFATDTESSRYALGGVLLEFEDERITAVATDGRRLAKMEGPVRKVGAGKLGEGSTIVPGRAMQLMERAITEADAAVQVAARPNDILVRSPRATIYSRLVEGRFPKWREVLPRRQDSARVQLAVGPLYSAIRQAAVVASDESRGVNLEFREGTLLLKGSTAEVGQSRVELPIPYVGPEVKVVLNHRFLTDFLRVLPSEQAVTMDIKDGESAVVFVTDDSYAYVVMPLSRES